MMAVYSPKQHGDYMYHIPRNFLLQQYTPLGREFNPPHSALSMKSSYGGKRKGTPNNRKRLSTLVDENQYACSYVSSLEKGIGEFPVRLDKMYVERNQWILVFQFTSQTVPEVFTSQTVPEVSEIRLVREYVLHSLCAGS